jgi:hypothetical protein
MLTFVEIILALACFVIVKVPYTLLKIKCSMRGQRALISSTIQNKILPMTGLAPPVRI